MKSATNSLFRAIIVFIIMGLLIASHPICHFFKSFSPSKDALVNIATVEGVLITIALPLSFEIVSRISERYGSGAVIDSFLHEWINKILLAYFIFNIIVVVFLSETSVKILQTSELTWQLLSWAVFALFVGGLGLFWQFTRILKRYVTDPGYVTDKLANDAEKALR